MDSSDAGGLLKLGALGRRRAQMCEGWTVSLTRSIAGACEVREAAVSTTVMPIPISASTRRRNRGMTSPGLYLRKSRKLMPPSANIASSMVILAMIIMPYEVPTKPPMLPT